MANRRSSSSVALKNVRKRSHKRLMVRFKVPWLRGSGRVGARRRRCLPEWVTDGAGVGVSRRSNSGDKHFKFSRVQMFVSPRPASLTLFVLYFIFSTVLFLSFLFVCIFSIFFYFNHLFTFFLVLLFYLRLLYLLSSIFISIFFFPFSYFSILYYTIFLLPSNIHPFFLVFFFYFCFSPMCKISMRSSVTKKYNNKVSQRQSSFFLLLL